MKKLILTLAIVAISFVSFGQTKDSVNKCINLTSKNTIISTNTPYIFKKVESEYIAIFTGTTGQRILEFKSNGDIIYKGKKLVTDTAIVNGLSEALTGKRRVK